MPIPTCSDDVNDKVLVVILNHRFECSRTEHLGSCSKIFWTSLYPLNMHRSKESTDLRGRNDIGGEEVFEGEFEIVRSKILGRFDELFEQGFELVGRVLCHGGCFESGKRVRWP